MSPKNQNLTDTDTTEAQFERDQQEWIAFASQQNEFQEDENDLPSPTNPKKRLRNEEPEKTLEAVGRKMLAKFDKYWRLDKVNPLLLVTVVLDPRFKMGYMLFTLETLYGKGKDGKDHPKTMFVLELLNKTLKNLYGWYAANNSASSVTPPSQILVESCADVEMDIASEWKRHNRSGNSGCMSEIDKYLTSPIEEDNDGSNFQILGWWKRNVKKYPVLSLVARDLLAIPVTSVASESAFSTGGRILDYFRSSLRPNTVEALICTQNWLRSTPKTIDLQASLQEIEEYDEIDEEIFEAAFSSSTLS